jgi:LCP family protein required for cell wall assembly
VAAGDEKKPRYRTYRAAGAEAAEGDPIAERARARAAAPPRIEPADAPIIELPEPGTRTPSRRPSTAPPRGPRRRLPRMRFVLALVGLLALLLVAWVAYGYWELRSSMQRANDRLTPATRAVLTPGGSLWGSASTILVLGSDARPGETSSRSDSILLVRVDPSRQQIAELSIPRDLRTEIPGHAPTKINAAYAYGGPPLAIRTVENLTGVKVNHVVLVNFQGFEKLIDVLGGVTIVNPTKIISNEFDGYHWRFGKGTLHLDGRHALAYSRVRENSVNAADNDLTRGQRQQRVLGALASKLGSPGTLLHLPTVGDALGEPLTTDLSASDLMALGWRHLRASRTLHCRLGGTPTTADGGQWELISSEENRQAIAEFLGRSAPQRPDPSSEWSPGCTIS